MQAEGSILPWHSRWPALAVWQLPVAWQSQLEPGLSCCTAKKMRRRSSVGVGALAWCLMIMVGWLVGCLFVCLRFTGDDVWQACIKCRHCAHPRQHTAYSMHDRGRWLRARSDVERMRAGRRACHSSRFLSLSVSPSRSRSLITTKCRWDSVLPHQGPLVLARYVVGGEYSIRFTYALALMHYRTCNELAQGIPSYHGLRDVMTSA